MIAGPVGGTEIVEVRDGSSNTIAAARWTSFVRSGRRRAPGRAGRRRRDVVGRGHPVPRRYEGTRQDARRVRWSEVKVGRTLTGVDADAVGGAKCREGLGTATSPRTRQEMVDHDATRARRSVLVGLTEPTVTNTLPSMIPRFGTSWVIPQRSTTEMCGRRPCGRCRADGCCSASARRVDGVRARFDERLGGALDAPRRGRDGRRR